MDQSQLGYHNIFLFLDRAFKSSALAEVLATVTSCAGYVEEMPFPIVVNAVLLCLAEVFQGEKFSPKLEQFLNVVRLSIVKAVREFHQYLHIAFSSDEIVRCVMKVSHSNDFHARSLTLLFLAALAPLVSENKKAHHLLIESLDCSEKTELSAGIYAVTEFGKHSVTFGALVVEKITEILCSSQTSFEVKLKLLNVVSNFKGSQNVIVTSFQLVNRLLNLNHNNLLHVAVFNASTTLAVKSSSAINDQIVLLLNELEKVISNNYMLSQCLLSNLARLAVFSQYWNESQITLLWNIFDKIRETENSKLSCAWLKCMEVLTATGIHCNILIEKNFSWLTLLRSEDLVLRISGIQLLINLMNRGSAVYLQGIFLIVVSETISDIHQSANIIPIENQKEVEVGELKFKDSSELYRSKRLFYKSISAFAKMPHCTTNDAFFIVKDLTRNLSCLSILKLDELYQDKERFKIECIRRLETLDIALQTLCALCDAHPVECAAFVSKWSLSEFFKIIKSATTGDISAERAIIIHFTISKIPFSLYNLILFPLQCTIKKNVIKNECFLKDNFQLFLSGIEKLIINNISFKNVTNLITSEKNTGWTSYKIARCAFRYGHWRSVAFPLLRKVFKNCKSLETSSWINALINISKSQIDESNEFSANQLNESYKYLRKAHLIFQRLTATPRREHSFKFAMFYTNCLALSWHTVWLILSTLNVKVFTHEQYQHYSNSSIFLSSYSIEQLCTSLTMVRYSITKTQKEWTSLYKHSFDADTNTLEQIELWIQFMFLLKNIILFLCAQPLQLSIFNEKIKNCYSHGNKQEYLNTERIFSSVLNNKRRCATNHHFFSIISLFKSLLELFQMEEELSIPSQKNENLENLCNIEIDKYEALNDTFSKNNLFIENGLQKRLTIKNLNYFKETLLKLKYLPLSLPKLFFQRTFRTTIKLNILPQARETDNNFVFITTPLLPLTVEGVIQSNNTKKIKNVTVLVEINCMNNSMKSFFDSRVIELDECDNYFKTQFLIEITESLTKINVKLLFTDSETNSDWIDESASAEMFVKFHEGKS